MLLDKRIGGDAADRCGWGAILIALLTIVVYLPALGGGFVFADGENRMLRVDDRAVSVLANN